MEEAKCGRWNPTAEQVKVLTELFNAGLRTPSTEQIRRISSHLSCLGKIESKNVFYWFQNHKARERQRCNHKMHRRRLTPAPLTASLLDPDNLFNADPLDERMEFHTSTWSGEEDMMKSQGSEMKTLELFPLTSTFSSSSSSSSFTTIAPPAGGTLFRENEDDRRA